MMKKILLSGLIAVCLHNAAQADSACYCGSSSAGAGCHGSYCAICGASCIGDQSGVSSSCSCERGQATNCPVHHAPILASSVCSSAAKEAVKSCVVPISHVALATGNVIIVDGCVKTANIPCAISRGMAAADHAMNAIQSAPGCINATQRAIAVCR
jgi:hypothetical protein